MIKYALLLHFVLTNVKNFFLDKKFQRIQKDFLSKHAPDLLNNSNDSDYSNVHKKYV